MLKICSKENILLGGIYVILDAPFFYANIEKVSSFLLVVFVLGLVIQCFKPNVFKLEQMLASYPRVSYYLSSIGWIPYFNILSIIALFVLAFVVSGNYDKYAIVGDVFFYISYISMPASLLVAFILKKF
jgi:hypothetical protein